MSDAQEIAAQLAAAVEAQRQNRDELFVHLRPSVAHLPGIREALRSLAAETGRTLVEPPAESLSARALREHAERMAVAPAINRNDHRKILENLDEIAAGKIRVE